jgi:hypothetical protein
MKPLPLQAFCPLQAFLALLQALWPLQAFPPLHLTLADAEAATKVVAAKTAAAVARTFFVFMFASPCSSRRWHPAGVPDYCRPIPVAQRMWAGAERLFTRKLEAFCMDH